MITDYNVVTATLTFRERFTLLFQGIVENGAHLAYLGTRSHLLRAAQLGYGSAN